MVWNSIPQSCRLNIGKNKNMKALYLESVNQYPEYKVVPKPWAASDEVLVNMLCASLNHRDLWISKGQYAGIKLPVIPGSCGCGMLGRKRVLIQPGFNWGKSQAFQSAEYRILGMPDHGTFAEWCKVPETMVYKCPAFLSDTEAAALPLAGLTAYRAVFTRGRVKPGDKVLISGVGGGVALFALQFALAAGAEVWVTSGSADKIRRAVAMGAKGGELYSEPDWHKQLVKASGGFDLVIDSAAGEGFRYFTSIVNPGGSIVFYGGTQGVINKLNPQQIFWKQLNIMGTTMGSPEEFKAMLKFVEKNKIRPVVDAIFTLEDGAQAYERMSSAGQFGKIVIQISNGNL